MDVLLDLAYCQDYRSFLRSALELQYFSRGQVNLSDFSRRAGFTSRSYLSELLAGKKGLSRDSLTRIKSALKLPMPYLRYFEALAFLSDQTLCRERLSEPEVHQKLHTIKKQLLSPKISTDQIKNISRVVSKTMLHRTYASLGTFETGAALTEITQRTGHTKSDALALLKILVDEGVAEFKNDRYYPRSLQMDLLGLKGNQGIADLVDEVCTEIRNRRLGLVDDPTNTMVYSAFSMDSRRTMEFRKRLKDVLFDLMDDFQEDNGDCVRQIFIANYSN